jgi:hypothetical protein
LRITRRRARAVEPRERGAGIGEAKDGKPLVRRFRVELPDP